LTIRVESSTTAALYPATLRVTVNTPVVAVSLMAMLVMSGPAPCASPAGSLNDAAADLVGAAVAADPPASAAANESPSTTTTAARSDEIRCVLMSLPPIRAQTRKQQIRCLTARSHQQHGPRRFSCHRRDYRELVWKLLNDVAEESRGADVLSSRS
jgi:hypothetical protein